jgi:hypothetical protein
MEENRPAKEFFMSNMSNKNPFSEPAPTPPNTMPIRAHGHYFKDVSHLKLIDIYRVLQLFEVNDPCLQHAIKKLLVAGGRGAKDTEKDIREAIDSLYRFLQMQSENSNGR